MAERKDLGFEDYWTVETGLSSKDSATVRFVRVSYHKIFGFSDSGNAACMKAVLGSAA